MTTDLAYFLLRPNGEQTGKFSLYQVKMMQKTGFIGPETRFWMEGMTEWLPVTRIEEFIDFRPPLSSTSEPLQGPLTWSGSLARAIPSPNQKPPSITKTVPASIPRKIEVPGVVKKPAITGTPLAKEEPSPVIPPESAAEPGPGVEEPPVVDSELMPMEKEASSQPGHLAGYLLLVIAALALLSALVYARSWIERKKTEPLNEITFLGSNIYAVPAQVTIRLFEEDLNNWPMAEELRQQIYQSEDADELQKLRVALAKEIAERPAELEEQYVQDGRAQFIEPGQYRVVGYFDDEGTLISARDGEAWVAIIYKDGIVYAHRKAP